MTDEQGVLAVGSDNDWMQVCVLCMDPGLHMRVFASAGWAGNCILFRSASETVCLLVYLQLPRNAHASCCELHAFQAGSMQLCPEIRLLDSCRLQQSVLRGKA